MYVVASTWLSSQKLSPNLHRYPVGVILSKKHRRASIETDLVVVHFNILCDFWRRSATARCTSLARHVLLVIVGWRVSSCGERLDSICRLLYTRCKHAEAMNTCKVIYRKMRIVLSKDSKATEWKIADNSLGRPDAVLGNRVRFGSDAASPSVVMHTVSHPNRLPLIPRLTEFLPSSWHLGRDLA